MPGTRERVEALERGSEGCQHCGDADWKDVHIVLHLEGDEHVVGPEHCPACGRRLVVTLDLSEAS